MSADAEVRARLAAALEAGPDGGFDDDRFRELVARIGPGSLEAVGGDHFGELYEDLAGGDRAEHAPGRVYTPPDVARTLARWAVRSTGDRVLDPCCGTGAITVAAHRRLTDLGCSHREALDRITAVDVDGLAVRLAALSLAARDRADHPEVTVAHHADFFDVDPGSDPTESALPAGTADPTDDAVTTGAAFGRFDATVANPPYVRQEAFADDRERVRAHLAAFGPDGATPYLDGDRAIDRRSDLYCYFLTNATRYLRPGGRLAWIVPTKWMTADYGRSVRRFLYDHYRLAAVVGVRGRVFEDAEVDAVLVLAERREADDAGNDTARSPGRTADAGGVATDQRAGPGESPGDVTTGESPGGVTTGESPGGVTNFVRVDGDADPATVVRAAAADPSIPEGTRTTVRSGPAHRTVAVRSSSLAARPDRKVDHYLDAPAAYAALVDHPDAVELGGLATVTRGKKTGANPIFVLDREDIETFGVEARFRRPAVKSVREVEGVEHTRGDARRWFLDVHDYVESVRSGTGTGGGSRGSDPDGGPAGGDPDLERAVRASLRADGHDGLLAYLDWAADRPARSNATLAEYDPWFDMGSLAGETAPLLCPQAMDTRRFVARTDGAVAASNRFLLVDPDGHDPDLLGGILNSTLAAVAVECHGRVTGGGAVNCSASDLRSLPVVDPRALSPAGRDRVARGFERLADGDRSGQDAVDRTLLEALDLGPSVAELRATAERLKRVRRGDAGTGDGAAAGGRGVR